jgi:hypothetical protein
MSAMIELKTEQLTDAWIQMLSGYPWEWFVTLTFQHSIHPEAADKKFRLWVSMINRANLGPRWYKKNDTVIWVRGLEYQNRFDPVNRTPGTAKDVIHYHAVMMRCGFQSRRYWMQEWEKIGGGFARIYPPESIDAVNGYLTKYITYGGEIDLSQSFNLLARRDGQTRL